MRTATQRRPAAGRIPAAHEANDEYLRACKQAARMINCQIAIFRTSTCAHDGHWRYAVHEGDCPSGTRSRDVLDYAEARYARYGLPSVKGEREALVALWEAIVEIAQTA